MTTFDCWEVAVRPPEDYLMHYRTPGSKNGVRRYQTESGEWTPLGLRERREREGWGDGESRKERKAQKRLEKAERTLAKSERHAARKQARIERRAAKAEKKRLSSLKGLTDEEMKKKLERAKMEAEYKELTKRTSLIEKGAEMVGKYLDYKDTKEQRALELNRQKVQLEQAKTQAIQAKNAPKRAKEEAKKAKQEAWKAKREADKAAITQKQDLLKAKMDYKNYTIRGGLAKRINMKLTSGQNKRYEAINNAKGKIKAQEMERDAQLKTNEDKARRAESKQRKEERATKKAERVTERRTNFWQGYYEGAEYKKLKKANKK